MRRRFLWILPIALLAIAPIFSLGCGRSEDAAPASTAGKGKGTIGVSLLTLTNPFFKVIGDTITAEAGKHGYETIVTSGEFDFARQQSQVEDLIVRKVSGIVLCPCASRSIGPAIEKAVAAG